MSSKVLKYTHVSGTDCQAAGYFIPASGLYIGFALDKLDKLVESGVLKRDLVDPPVHKPAVSTPVSTGENKEESKSGEDSGSKIISVVNETTANETNQNSSPVIYKEEELRQLTMQQLRDIGYTHAVKGQSFDAIIEGLKAKNLVVLSSSTAEVKAEDPANPETKPAE